MEEKYAFHFSLASRFLADAKANLGDAPHVLRILHRAIASLEKEMSAEKKELMLRNECAGEDCTAQMTARATRMMQSILESLDFTFCGKTLIYDMYASPETRPSFTSYAKTVIQRTYSGEKEGSGIHETWADIVVRVIETIFYFRKVQLLSLENKDRPADVFSAEWDEAAEQKLATAMAFSMYKVEWLPPGRGIQMCRKKLIQSRGSMVLYNCAFGTTGYCPDQNTAQKFAQYNKGKKQHPYGLPDQRPDVRAAAVESFLDTIEWGATSLMSGVGVGFDSHFNLLLEAPREDAVETFVIPDTREAWAYSIRLLLASYLNKNSRTVQFDYSRIRPKGAFIRSFGGTASGPGALRLCHERIRAACRCLLQTQKSNSKEQDDREAIAQMLLERLPHELAFLEEEDATLVEKKQKEMTRWIEAVIHSPYFKTYGTTRACIDICNFIGVCVRMGNLRRSAIIMLGSPDDEEFFNAKDYEMHPERVDVGGTSNNSIQLFQESQYERIAKKLSTVVGVRGEPGIVNMVRIWEHQEGLAEENAEGMNPCGETPLKPFEVCDLVETFPCNAPTIYEWIRACKHATLFASIVTCIPTASEKTNQVVAQNHRLGVSQTGLFQFYEKCANGKEYEERLEMAYRAIREVADAYVMKITGVRPIRVTVVKPSGTIAPIGNAPPGIHPPIESRYVIRRIRIARNKPLSALLIARGVPCEVDVTDPTAFVFDFVLDQGNMRTAAEITMWELGALAMATQKHYADNAVSLSLYVNKHADTPPQIYAYLKRYLHHIKTISFMPRESEKALMLNNGATVFFPLFADHQSLFHRLSALPTITPEMMVKANVVSASVWRALDAIQRLQQIKLEAVEIEQCQKTAPELSPLIAYAQATSFIEDGVASSFAQMPRAPYLQAVYEAISKEEYERLSAIIGTLDFDGTPFETGDQDVIQGCDGLQCSRE